VSAFIEKVKGFSLTPHHNKVDLDVKNDERFCMLQTPSSPRCFYVILTLIVIISLIIRLWHYDEFSLWSDELYSMLTVDSKNSFKEMILLQINDNQPPMYMILLKSYFSLFGYNEYNGKFFSLFFSVISVYAIGVCNKVLFNPLTGLISALILAFSIKQIEHSFEIRFYSMIVFSSICIFYAFFNRRKSKIEEFSLGQSITYGVVAGCFVLSHYFFVFLILSLFIVDCLLIRKVICNNFLGSIRWILPYLLSFFFLLFWFILLMIYKSTSDTINSYWLKEIDVISFVTYPLGNAIMFIVIMVAMLLYFSNKDFLNKDVNILFFVVTFFYLITLCISFLKFPICVPRYSLIVSPFLIGFVSFNLSALCLKNGKLGLCVNVIIFSCFLLVSLGYLVGSQKVRAKEPWREMAGFVSSLRDRHSTPIISFGYMLNNKFTIQYYLPSLKISNFKYMNSNYLNMDSFYLIQTNGHDRMDKSDSFRLNQLFFHETIKFGFDEYGKGGNVSKYRRINTYSECVEY
jgi:hypothetical protein